MANLVYLLQTNDCPPGECRELAVGGRLIAIYNVDGKFHALDGVCPHQGGPLGKGQLDGPIVTCPWHGWQFDVRTGQQQISASICQESIPLVIEGDRVLAELDVAP